jgi:multidrug transporter EmrE-like cation transporter
MSAQGLFLIVLAAGMTVVGNLMMRAGVVQAGGVNLSLDTLAADLFKLAGQPLLIGGLALYALASLVWFRVISTESLNTSYPILVSLTFLFVTAGATFFFHEPLSPQKIVGVLMILGGIIAVATAN